MTSRPKESKLSFSTAALEVTNMSERQARGENMQTEITSVTSTDNTPRSPESPPPLYDKKPGSFTKRVMEENRQFGGDDYMFATRSRKTNEEVRKENEDVIRKFETMAMANEASLRMKPPVVFANTDFAIALVGRLGCRLGFTDGSAYLDIPANALEEYKTIYMYKLPERADVTGPADKKKIYCYSGLITCGPQGTTFNRDVTLNFEHCAALDDNKGSLRLAVLGRENETTPWMKKEQTRFVVKANRVENHLGKFSDRCYGLEETDVAANPPRLRMCLMLVVSQGRRQYVEVVLMRDEISLINARRDYFITRGFEPNEVHVHRTVFINPTELVSFEGMGFQIIERNDRHTRDYYYSTIRTARTGRVELHLRQPCRQTPIETISITEGGHTEIDRDVANLQAGGLLYPYVHFPIQVEDFGRKKIQCPDFALSFTEENNLQTFNGIAPSEEREQSVEGGALDQPEAAENLPCPIEEMIVIRVATDAHSSGAEESTLPVDDLYDPRPPDGDSHQADAQPQDTLKLLGQNGVVRRRNISTSSFMSDESEIGEQPEAVSGGDNESLTSCMRSRNGSPSSKREDGNESGN